MMDEVNAVLYRKPTLERICWILLFLDGFADMCGRFGACVWDMFGRFGGDDERFLDSCRDGSQRLTKNYTKPRQQTNVQTFYNL